MTKPIRLSKHLADLVQCSRSEAEQYIRGGWVSVDGRVVEDPAHPVSGEVVTLDAAARLDAVEPATFLLHKPAGFDTIHGPKPAAELVQAATRWPDDPSGVRLLQRHFHQPDTAGAARHRSQRPDGADPGRPRVAPAY